MIKSILELTDEEKKSLIKKFNKSFENDRKSNPSVEETIATIMEDREDEITPTNFEKRTFRSRQTFENLRYNFTQKNELETITAFAVAFDIDYTNS